MNMYGLLKRCWNEKKQRWELIPMSPTMFPNGEKAR